MLRSRLSQRVPKNVHPGARQPGAAMRLVHDTPDDVGGHGFVYRRHVPNKNPAARGLGAFRSQVFSDGGTGELRQRQHIGSSRFAPADANGASHPVDVVKFQRDRLAAAQPQVDDAAHEGVTAQARRQIRRKGKQQPMDLVGRERLRQGCKTPMRRRGDHRQQVLDAIALEGTQAQVAAHCGRSDAAAGGAHPREFLGQEMPQLVGRRCRCVRGHAQKRANDCIAPKACAACESLGVQQVIVEAQQLLVDGAARVMILLHARGADNSQQALQSCADLVATALHRSSASAARQGPSTNATTC